jgi:hypothetical protein
MTAPTSIWTHVSRISKEAFALRSAASLAAEWLPAEFVDMVAQDVQL